MKINEYHQSKVHKIKIIRNFMNMRRGINSSRKKIKEKLNQQKDYKSNLQVNLLNMKISVANCKINTKSNLYF